MAHETTVIRIRNNLKARVQALSEIERRSFTEEMSILLEDALQSAEQYYALPFELSPSPPSTADGKTSAGAE